ncbi:hypothetical protein A3I27_02280 [Candidatus Giovannonibacteria bacterium RIFCSPLOWO2_02_FULL_43_11b]|uniref:Uncharacterized protein n=1 Tax=Candidatus Giovannonibacteria bacterium RIFCSPHIGHO2_12_FULL_43_15 TaxID=1798341 RepID=A0A1F5WNH7_9BACT|nr:MAG: hypothetical protein A3B97_00045 [Candidatus Giovannonibacteria bacterium RIFCSPHIGHO2_02_FULL_43_32]OGF77180.1 MAG: hypothetical protein A3F23_01385 [Candidatus Giovannonibacteria bacterium RIFCSPHIGHO2_12_FULL_43_15]OGF78909.1 MAG: hypothetical protein A3A15_03340 [Candidatus Giovannonibacteria bacterium RIFCSPLOWO2_01_FULL_43_60]OGF89010.1 MAG: hypothetical protein A3I27_02280 [Candidatus Giovannonibacteria bacterium RIFCSPLOWO2_02_FULL_43_11b]OGF91489.1 MAG: hypothetical protein A3H
MRGKDEKLKISRCHLSFPPTYDNSNVGGTLSSANTLYPMVTGDSDSGLLPQAPHRSQSTGSMAFVFLILL